MNLGVVLAAGEAASRGGRPLALLAIVLVAAAWFWRDRVAERHAKDHDLAKPIALARDADVLRRAEEALADEAEK
jgi:hypothetical protein